jgi:hypothetical protein
MTRKPPRRGTTWMFCLWCHRAISRGFRLPTGELACRECWQARQHDDGDDAS